MFPHLVVHCAGRSTQKVSYLQNLRWLYGRYTSLSEVRQTADFVLPIYCYLAARREMRIRQVIGERRSFLLSDQQRAMAGTKLPLRIVGMSKRGRHRRRGRRIHQRLPRFRRKQ